MLLAKEMSMREVLKLESFAFTCDPSYNVIPPILYFFSVVYDHFICRLFGGEIFEKCVKKSVIFINQKHFKYGEYFAIHYPE